jgi:hypothetical protein
MSRARALAGAPPEGHGDPEHRGGEEAHDQTADDLNHTFTYISSFVGSTKNRRLAGRLTRE